MAFWKIKLRTLLLSVFLSTILVSSAAIISFTYVKYSKSIHSFSLETIERSGLTITEKIGCIVKEVERLPSLGMFFFERFPQINEESTDLIAFFLGILKQDPTLFAYDLALPDGSYLSTFNLSFFKQDPSWFEPVPDEAAYLALAWNASSPNASPTIVFFNRDFDRLSDREFPTDYDPRTRPWYVGAKSAKTLYWANLYPHYFAQSDLGFTASEPFYDKTGQLIAIIGADLSFDLISQFTQNQRVSKHGKTYVVDANGKILLPREPVSEAERTIVSEAYKTFVKTQQSHFSYDLKKKSYLASFHLFPTSFNTRWTILTVAPRSDFFAEFISTQRDALLLSFAVLAFASFFVVIVSIHISKPIVQLGNEIDKITRLDLESPNRTLSHIEEIRLIDDSVASMRTALRSFGRYVPKELAKQLMFKEHDISLGGKMKTISIFFTDIANFTSIAERLPMEKVNTLLTKYFEVLTRIILDCGGTIDKYIGDGIMSIWGAPDDLPNFAERACEAALLCQKRLEALHEEWRKEELPLFETRMGIGTGPVFVGNFGTTERMNYSAIGDAVNTAARLQDLNKMYHTQIIIEEETMHAAGPKFFTRPLGTVEVRGKKNKLKIFELVSLIDE